MTISPYPAIKASAETINQNEVVRKALADNGDDGTAPREIRYYFYPEYFPDKKGGQIAAKLEALGFIIVRSDEDYGLIAEEVREVKSSDFDSLTEALKKLMMLEGWQYDGWDCAVV